MADKQEFFNEAKKQAEINGYDPLIILTHAWYETAGFSKVIGQNNYFGLKTPLKTKWDGLTVVVSTKEQEKIINNETAQQAIIRLKSKYSAQIDRINKSINGKAWIITLKQTFRDWNKLDEAIKYYCDFIKTNYCKAYLNRKDYIVYFKSLVDGKIKYGTDMSYANECINLYRSLKKWN